MQRYLADREAVLLVDKALQNFFSESLRNARHINPSYERLWEAINALFQSGGKRLRSQMVLVSYAAFGGTNSEKITPVAAAQELLHASLLMHDDIIDRDYVRYGTANVAGQFKELYAQYLDNSDEQLHYANGAALLAGDLLLSGAYHLIATASLDNHQKQTVQNLLARSIFEVAGGELMDSEASFIRYDDGESLVIARYKTAGYSFVTPLVSGAVLAGASDDQLVTLNEFATALGIAFQLVDDMLGVFAESATTGKSNSSDITEGKHTYMVEQALQAMTSDEEQTFKTLFNNKSATDEEIQTVKHLLITSGAKEATERKVKEYVARAEESLARLEFEKAHTDVFTSLIQRVVQRAY